MSRRFPIKSLLAIWLATLACGTLAGPGPAAGPTAGPTVVTPEARSAQLSEFQKTVESQTEENTAWQPAAVGQIILTGGGARTGDEARARLDISDGTLVRLGAETVFRLVELTPAFSDPVTLLELDAGKVWVWVTAALGLGKFEVSTPAGLAGVRGSLMSVEYDPATGRMTVTCLEGQCYVAGASGATTDLGPGEQAEIGGPGQDPAAARPMDDAELVEWAQEFPEAQTAVAAATAAPRPTATRTPQSACDHPYFPLRQGAAWQQTRARAGADETQTRTWVVESVTGDLDSASATIVESIGEATSLTYTWNCTAEGVAYFRLDDIGRMVATIVTFYNVIDTFYSMDSSADVAAINHAMDNQSGVSLPPPAELKPGASWTNNYTMRYAGQSSSVEDAWITYVVEVSETHTAGEEQTLDTPAGTFAVWPISIQTHTTKTSEFSHGPQGFGKVGPNLDAFDSATTIYYAEGVGVVRMEYTSDTANTASELQSYSLP